MNSFGILSLLVSQPRKAFDELAERPRYWFPLLLAVVLGAGTVWWYYHVADLAWVIDETLRSSPRGAQMTEEQRATATRFMSPGVLTWSSVIGVIVVIPLLRVLQAAYFLLAGKVTNVQRTFRQWFALANWTSLPGLLAVIPLAVVLLTSTNGQIDSSAMQPLSLNELFFHRRMGEPGFSLLTNLQLLQPVCWLLAIIGVQHWSARSWVFSTVFVLLPSVLVYGTWALFAFK